jgi:hypothetical protein
MFMAQPLDGSHFEFYRGGKQEPSTQKELLREKKPEKEEATAEPIEFAGGFPMGQYFN